MKPASSVRPEPHIYPPGSTVPDANLMRGDVSVFGFWEPQTEAIFDVQVVHTEAPSLLARSPASILKSREAAKKGKYRKVLEEQRKHFSPFVCSTDGVFADEASALINHLAGDLAAKWERPYSIIVSQLRTSLSFALVRSAYQCAFNPRSNLARGWDLFEDGSALQPPFT